MVTSDRFPLLTIQNLRNDAVARLHLNNLEAKLQTDEQILQPGSEPIPYNEWLRGKMQALME